MSIRTRTPGTFETNEIEQTESAVHELRRIKNYLEVISASSGAPTGGSTEAKQDTQITQATTINSTLISILNNMIASKDIEVLLVRDTGAADIVVQQIREYDEGTGVFVTRYEDVNGAAYVPVGPLVYLDSSAVLNLILTELQLKADLTETQPVSLATIPLPTGAATQTTLAALLTELQLKADLSETQPISLAVTVRTPALIRATGSSSVSAGARSVSVYNAGGANGTVLGVTIKPGEQISWDAGAQGDTLSAVAYDGTGTELVITTIV